MDLTFNDLFDLQQKFDLFILKKNKYPDINSKIVGLYSEIGEFCNELESHKYWKKNKKTNKDKVLEEFADILFFYISIANEINISPEDIIKQYLKKYKENVSRQENGY
jgi:dimeric dUTPase (all-alpha-NTP-PPase superfamily)